jgi:ParB family chromosome partitioning protein
MPKKKSASPKRQALGRGLDALLPKPAAALPEIFREAGGVLEIDLSKIDPSPHQPRMRVHPEALAELAHSIKETGVLQPVLVRPAKRRGRFQLIAGERRLRAAKLAGLRRIPAVVRDAPDERLLELALVENIQRENLSPLEEARAYKTLSETYSLTQEKIAKRVGKSRATVANAMRLLALPPKCQKLLEDGSLSSGHAKVLLSLGDAALQERLAERIAKENLSVRAAEALAKAGVPSDGRPSRRKAAAGETSKDPNVRRAEEGLQRVFGTKVVIHGRGGQGRIEIFYYSANDLHRLYDQLLLSRGK